jgi:hypothetical protein
MVGPKRFFVYRQRPFSERPSSGDIRAFREKEKLDEIVKNERRVWVLSPQPILPDRQNLPVRPQNPPRGAVRGQGFVRLDRCQGAQAPEQPP